MNWVQLLILVFVVVGGCSLVVTREPRNLALIYSFYGLVLTLFLSALHTQGALSSLLALAGIVLLLLLVTTVVRRVELRKRWAGFRRLTRRAGRPARP